MPVVDELVHRHELYRCHSEALEVVDAVRMREAAIGTPNLSGQRRAQRGEAFHVRFIDDRAMPGNIGGYISRPVKERCGYNRPWRKRRAVLLVETAKLRGILVAEQCIVPLNVAPYGPRVRIEEQLAGIAQQALLRAPGTIDAEPVALPGVDMGQIPVPPVAGYFGQLDLRLPPRVVEEAQAYALGYFGVQRKVRPGSVVGRTQGIGSSRQYFQAVASVKEHASENTLEIAPYLVHRSLPTRPPA